MLALLVARRARRGQAQAQALQQLRRRSSTTPQAPPGALRARRPAAAGRPRARCPSPSAGRPPRARPVAAPAPSSDAGGEARHRLLADQQPGGRRLRARPGQDGRPAPLRDDAVGDAQRRRPVRHADSTSASLPLSDPGSYATGTSCCSTRAGCSRRGPKGDGGTTLALIDVKDPAKPVAAAHAGRQRRPDRRAPHEGHRPRRPRRPAAWRSRSRRPTRGVARAWVPRGAFTNARRGVTTRRTLVGCRADPPRRAPSPAWRS